MLMPLAPGGSLGAMIRTAQPELASELFPAKQRLVSTVAAGWGATAAEHALAIIGRLEAGEAVRAVLEELARIIVAEAQRRFGAEPELAEVWREAAHEAACARFEAVARGRADSMTGGSFV